jgi:hypothetical protein
LSCIWGCMTYRQGIDWILDLLTTCIHHSELHFTVHWHTQTGVLSLLQSLLAISWQRLLLSEILQLPTPRSRTEFLSTDNSTNWVPGWWPFRTNLLVFSSQADFQLTTELTHQPATSRHFTQLKCWQLLTNNHQTVKVKVKVKVTLWLAVYRQSVSLGVKPLETHDQNFFFNWTPAVIVLM